MNVTTPSLLTKLKWSLPWIARYPLWRAAESIRRMTDGVERQHLIFVVANHFEPSWRAEGGLLDLKAQLVRLDEWCMLARRTGGAVQDSDGTPFRHTNFYPAEQYYPPLIEKMAELQSDGFGEIEVHLHHGVETPDTAANLRRELETFRDVLAQDHKCLSRLHRGGPPMYAFVHGNLALANSAGGRFCGVDDEMQVLAETGCYADFTLPSAPDQSQVPRVNAIYQCGRPLHERRPHRAGPTIKVGESKPVLPLIFTGPLTLDWRRRINGVPVPRLDDGALAANYPPDLARFRRWAGARIGVLGRPEWIFVKLYCHGFFTFDQDANIGSSLQRFWDDVLELSTLTGRFSIHFASAREAFNMVIAAVDGQQGEPGLYRDYRLQLIMTEQSSLTAPAITTTRYAPASSLSKAIAKLE